MKYQELWLQSLGNGRFLRRQFWLGKVQTKNVLYQINEAGFFGIGGEQFLGGDADLPGVGGSSLGQPISCSILCSRALGCCWLHWGVAADLYGG